MGLNQALLFAFLTTQLFDVSFGAPFVESRDNVCSNGIYGELSPILKQYPIAVVWCSAFYPVSCTGSNRRRGIPSTTSSSKSTSQSTSQYSTTTKSKSITSTTTAVAVMDLRVSALSKATCQPVNVVRTLCSCIETPKACPTKSITATTPKTITTTTPITSPPSTTPSTTPSSTDSVTTSTTANPFCTAGTYSATDGAQYIVRCGVSYFGKNGRDGPQEQLGFSTGIPNANACAEACETYVTGNCVAADFVEENLYCYFLSGTGDGEGAATGVDGISRVSGPTRVPSTTIPT